MNMLWILMLSGEGEHKGGLLDIDPGLMIWTIITFVVLLVLLKFLAWGPIIEMLQEREGKIRSSLEEAEKARREAAELMGRNNEILAKAERDAQDIARRAKETAEKIAHDIAEKAKVDATKLVETAKKEIESEKQNALSSLRQEVAEMAIQAAGKILAVNLDADKHKKLVDDFIKTIPSSRN